MKNDPCAKLKVRVTPKTSANPRAIKAYTDPIVTPSINPDKIYPQPVFEVEEGTEEKIIKGLNGHLIFSP